MPTNLADLGLRLVTHDPTTAAGERVIAVSPLAAQMISEQTSRRFGIVATAYRDGVLKVAASQPPTPELHDAVVAATGYELEWVLAEPAEIAQATESVYSSGFQAGPDDPMLDAEALVHLGLAIPPRLGEELVVQGIISEEQLDDAVAQQERSGSQLGEVLMHNGVLEEQALMRVLAQRFELPLVDLTDFDPTTAPRDVIPERVARALHCVPIAVDDQTVFVAVTNPIDDEIVAELRKYTDLEIRGFLASPNGIDELLQRIHREEYTIHAQSELLMRFPEDSANRVVTSSQKVVLLAMLIGILGALVLFPLPTMIGLVALSSAFYIFASAYKLMAGLSALDHQYEVDITPEMIADVDERTLPTYTILVPLYKEAEVVGQLVNGIEQLDYPKTKLDVRLLCEEDDDETIAAVRGLNAPPHIKLVVVPESHPRTKPKACNYGLLQAEGEIVVIYDAEDRPDPDQLKKSVLMFRLAGDDRLVCVQAKLNYFNQDQNLLTRWFSIEYAMLFDLVLPGLDARSDPIPLGGTSNHMIKDRILEIGGWDPYNVTEDADLGIRLHKVGYRTAMMDSTTLEEANSELANWVRQRSRWIKGYIQTWLVHMRHPLRLLSEVGPRAFISFQLLIGGTFIFLLNPIFWGLTTIFLLTQASFIEELFPGFIYYAAATLLFLGNFVFLYMGVVAAVRRGYHHLAKYALLTPLYWGLMSLAAWKGFLQLFTNPFYWEKTQHGLDRPAEAPGVDRPANAG